MAADGGSNTRLMLGGMVVCSIASMAFSFASSTFHMEFVMVMVGGMQGAAWVPATKLVASWFEDSSYATMFSVLGCGSTVAGMLLPLLQSLYWRTVMFSLGAFMLIFTVTSRQWVLTEDANPRDRKESVAIEEQKAGYKTIMKSPVIWHIAIVYFFSMEMRTICETWIPVFLDKKKVSSVEGFQFLYELGGLSGGVISGMIADRLAGRIGVDPARRVIGVFFTITLMLAAIAVFNYAQYSTLLGFPTGFFLYGSINIWCLIGSQAGYKSFAGTVSASVSFIASFGSIFAGIPLANLIAAYSMSIFTKIFVTQIVFVLFISIFRIPLRMGTVSDEKKQQ